MIFGPNNTPTGRHLTMVEKLVAHGGVEGLRSNVDTPMLQDAQTLFDKAVLKVGRQKLVLVDYLIRKGLTFPLRDWMSRLEVTWSRSTSAGNARHVFSPDSRGERGKQLFDTQTLPVYMQMEDFQFPIRELLASRNRSVFGTTMALDTGMASESTFNVNELIEDSVLYGPGDTIQLKGNDVPGLLTHPNVNNSDTQSNRSWTNASHTGANMVTDLLDAIAVLQGVKKWGPYTLLLPLAYSNRLAEDYSASKGDNSILERLRKIEFIDDIITIPMLPADTMVLFEPTVQTLDLMVGQTPRLISWLPDPGFNAFFAVLACIIPRIKVSKADECGICIITPDGTYPYTP